MTVTGDTKSLELPDLLQNFEAHQRSCTLVLTTESGKAYLYMREGKIAAFAADGRAALAELLVAWKLLSSRHLEEARKKKRKSRKTLVEILLQSGAIREEKLRAAAEAALVEDVSNLVASGTKSFEFSNEEAPLEVFDKEELFLALAIPVNATLLEAARRSDHWALIRKSIPVDTATFVARDGIELPQDLEDRELGQELLAALDGTRNAKEATDLFPRSRLQAYEYLARFVRDRLVRLAVAEDLVAVAGSLEQDEPERARKIVARGLEVEPHHLSLLAFEASLAQRLKLPKAAAAALKVVAHVFSEAGDTARSRQALDQARALDPADATVRERILALDLEEGRFAEAVQDGMKLVTLYRAPGLHAKAREVLERLVEADPKSLQIRVELARSQVDSGDPEAAVDGLLRHGKKLVSREEYVDARKLYKEVLTIGPSHKEAKRSLEMIDKEIFARRRERRRRIKRFVVATLAVLAFGALLSLEVAARIDFARTAKLISREALVEQRLYGDAIAAYEALAARHPLTATVLFDVQSRIDDLKAQIKAAPASRDPRGK